MLIDFFIAYILVGIYITIALRFGCNKCEFRTWIDPIMTTVAWPYIIWNEI